MTTSIKVPKEVQELFWESDACRELARAHDEGILPSLKAIYYASRAGKARTLAWRALKSIHAEVSYHSWHYNELMGSIVKDELPVAVVPKKARKPRVAKEAAPTAAGENK
jgi:hypothetical protein